METVPHRPAQPDQDMLLEAERSLRRLRGESQMAISGWKVGGRIDRNGSSVFPLHLPGSIARVDAFYKEALLKDGGADPLQARIVKAQKDGLARCMEVESSFAEMLDGEEITFSRTLAVDPERLVSVTRAVPGRPFGRPILHVAPRQRRLRAHALIEMAGRAARLVGSVEGSSEHGDDNLDLARVEKRLARIEPVLERDLYTRLVGTFDSLHREIIASEAPSALAHGDLSSSNILVNGELGLIDFAWVPRTRNYDVANFAFRLEFYDLIPASVSREFRKCLLNGYGVPDLADTPHWRFLRLANLINRVHTGGGAKGRKRVLMDRAVREIRGLAC